MAGTIVRGEIHLSVDLSGLEAHLVFKPVQDGPEWGADSLQKLIAEARLVGVPGKRPEEILQSFSKSKTTASEMLVLGQIPEQGAPESAEWTETTTPPEYQPFEPAAVAEAKPPALYRIRVDRIAKERIVKKTAALPFLPPKQEKVTEYEKVEVREPLAVDTRVLRTFWTSKGSLVARVYPAKPGKPGKDVYGKPVMPERFEDSNFALGKGLARDKGNIVAESSGFVRVGARWADLVPFQAGEYSIRLSADSATALLDYTPGDTRLPPPDAGVLLQEAVALGVQADTLLSVGETEAALLRATRSGQVLSGFSLSCDRDAVARVDVSADKLKATLTVVKGRGKGKPLELSMVSAALAGHKFKGVKIDKLKADVVAFYKGKQVELLDYPLVEGKDPVKGKDRELIFGVAFLPEDQVKDYLAVVSAAPGLSRAADNLAEFSLSAATRVALVDKGQEVARFSPPSTGQPGLDVYGEAIPSPPGNDPVIKAYGTLRILSDSLESEDDGLLLVAENEGATLARVLPYRDARVAVSVSDDGMNASVSVTRGYGLGRELSVDTAQGALKQAGVVNGVDIKELSAVLAEAREGRPVTGRIVAKGRMPVAAGGFRLNWIVRMASGAALTVRADGSADYKNQDKSTIVVKGQPLLELLAIGVEGQDGVDVLGSTIPAPKDPSVSEPPTFDSSITEEKTEAGNRLLTAGMNGGLRFENNMLSIDPTQKIAGDIGPATGNVRFPGPVAVAGTVLAGYAVFAGGDVLITGSVEAALVSSDGSVKVTEGVKGARKGTIRARKSIEAAFAEQAQLLAVEDIVLKNSALMCNIKTNGKLTLQGDRGHLIGGVCRVRKGMEVQNLGSANSSRTQVSFGQDYLVKDAIEAEEQEIERTKSMILETDKKMREMESSGANLDAIRQNKLKLIKLLEKRSLRIFELREKFEEHFPGEIVVRGSIFAGVVIESHNRFHEVRQTKQKVVFSFDPQLGRVVERPLK
jgi:uncharacterized protein (DUF342 family)